MSTNKIQVPDNTSTYLATLYGKAMDAKAEHPILGDRWAADAVARIDYDWAALNLPRGNEITLPLRALHFDTWTHEFLATHPACTVLHLGCGLDTRVFRINSGPDVHWFDVDMPDVIAIREQLYPARQGYQMIGASVLDLDWLNDVPQDLPVCVIGEGLMMYLPQREGTALIREIVARFPNGHIAFDGYSGWMVRLVSRLATVRGAKVELVWGIDDPHDLAHDVPGLRLMDDVAFLAMPELIRRLGTNRASGLLYGGIARLPFYRHLVRHVRYMF